MKLDGVQFSVATTMQFSSGVDNESHLAWISLRIDLGTPTHAPHPPIGTHWAHTAPDVRARALKSSDGTQWARLVPVPFPLARFARH